MDAVYKNIIDIVVARCKIKFKDLPSDSFILLMTDAHETSEGHPLGLFDYDGLCNYIQREHIFGDYHLVFPVFKNVEIHFCRQRINIIDLFFDKNEKEYHQWRQMMC